MPGFDRSRRVLLLSGAGMGGPLLGQTAKRANLKILLLGGRLSVCRLAPAHAIPEWAAAAPGFVSITRTADELSVVCAEERVPEEIKVENGWRAFKVEGPLDFALTGILESIAKPLAGAGISIFAVSTYDTDYVLVKEEKVEAAARALTAAGHSVKR